MKGINTPVSCALVDSELLLVDGTGAGLLRPATDDAKLGDQAVTAAVKAVNNFDGLYNALLTTRSALDRIRQSGIPDPSDIVAAVDIADTAIGNAAGSYPEPEKAVYIVVEGGIVKAVYSRTPGLEVEVLDYDNAEADSESALEEMRRQENVLIKHAYEATL